MLQRAQEKGERLAVIFSDGAICSRIVGWALVESIERHGAGTALRFSRWQPLEGPCTQELILRNSGEPIADGFIRPYALCVTPWFIQSTSTPQPTATLQRAWVVKGRERRNDFERMLVPQARGPWITGKPPRAWAAGDFVFLWESAPGSRIIGLARLTNTDLGEYEGDHQFELEYLTGLLAHPVRSAVLKDDDVLGSASFLKAGPAGTLFPINDAQSVRLAHLVTDENPSCAGVLEDHLVGLGALAASQSEYRDDIEWEDALDPDDLAFFESEFDEGRKKLVMHVVRERSARARERAKEAHRARTGGMRCSICRFDFEHVYGELGRDFAEVHHAAPLAQSGDRGGPTRLEDLVVVCANCHRMLHRSREWLTVDALSRLIAG
jgi:hypothetical protein